GGPRLGPPDCAGARRRGPARTARRLPPVSGVTFTIDPAKPAGSRVSSVRVAGQPLDPGKPYRLAIVDYTLEGGDGYTMFAGAKVLVTPERGAMLLPAVEAYVRRQKTIAPK